VLALFLHWGLGRYFLDSGDNWQRLAPAPTTLKGRSAPAPTSEGCPA
jgi:hypothetical protein